MVSNAMKKYAVLLFVVAITGCRTNTIELTPCRTTSDCEAEQICYDGWCLKRGSVAAANCGNGSLDTGEGCDDGNFEDNDSCTASCQDAVCGDGILRADLAASQLGFEECDSNVDDGVCTDACLLPACGDRIVQVGEACDDGNDDPNDGCDDCVAINNQPLSGITSVVGSSNHTCALNGEGAVFCWGGNRAGELGNGSYIADWQVRGVSRPVVVRNLPAVVQVAAGTHHTCARTDPTESDEVWCWGMGQAGQLGNSSNESSLSPVQVVGLPEASEVCGGRDFTCARSAIGQIRCWGANNFGELGDGTNNDRNTPGLVVDLPTAVELSCGLQHSCIRTEEGSVWCWGLRAHGQLGDEGTIQWPDGDHADHRTRPVQVVGLTNATKIALGTAVSCAIRNDNTVVCWGKNDEGQLGNGSNEASSLPVQVSNLVGVTHLGRASSHNCAVTTGGDAYCWGANNSGELGDGTGLDSIVPVGVVGLPPISQIQVGGVFVCALDLDGHVWCFGYNGLGRLGNGTGHDLSADNGTGEAVASPVAVLAPE